ncbi:hypothetical protein [uncultured Candidatus Puniceispirillum sp.]|uniref:hypothetical protein n=1 Tax=uncultured Candidatus Puniceispirillum sp. TaxID=1985115 RepID=UPI0032B287C6
MEPAESYLDDPLTAETLWRLHRIRSRLNRAIDDTELPETQIDIDDLVPVALRGFQLGRTIIRAGKFFAAFAVIAGFVHVGLIALPVLSQSVLKGGVSGVTVGTFDGGGTQLTLVSHLSDQTAAPREYVAQYFTPTVTGSYTFGLSSSNEDTVLILYENSFDDTSPRTNAVEINDDVSSAPYGAGGVVMGVCGAQLSYCPRITYNLTANQVYYIVVTSYAPSMTVSDGVNFYIYGEPVVIGTAAEEAEAAAVIVASKVSLKQAISFEASRLLNNFMSFDGRFIRDARTRHIAAKNKAAQAKAQQRQAKLQLAADKKAQSQRPELALLSRNATGVTIEGKVTDKERDLNGALTKKLDKTSGTAEAILFGDFQYSKQKDGTTSGHVNTKLAWEKKIGSSQTNGIFVGSNLGSSHIKGAFPGRNRFAGLSIGAYTIWSPLKDLHISGYATLGGTANSLKVNNGSKELISTFTMQTASIGLSTTGVMKIFRMRRNQPMTDFSDPRAQYDFVMAQHAPGFEIWPTMDIQYGISKISGHDAKSIISGSTDMLTMDADTVRAWNLRISPEIKFNIDSMNEIMPRNKFTFAPSLMCQRVRSSTKTSACGLGLGLYLSDADERHKWLKFEIQNLDSQKDLSGSINLTVPF